ncbi:MAG: hypothetical protein ACE5R4_12350 [Armatimonadota bacterium]
MRMMAGVAASVLLSACVMAAPGDGPNLAAPDSLDAGRWSLEADLRLFEGDNTSSSFQVTYGTSDHSEVAIGFVTFDNVGPDLIAGSLRRSELDMLAFSYRLVDGDVDQRGCGFAGQLDLEVPLTWRGTNLDANRTAEAEHSIATFSFPFGGRPCDRLVLRAQPKLVLFEDYIPNSLGGQTEGFGTVLAVTAGGVLELSERWELFADLTDVWAGDNAICRRTGRPTDRTVWTAGARVEWAQGDRWLEAYLTNGSGLTTATSVLAAPDDEALSLRGGISF